MAQPVSLGEVESPLVFCPALSHSWGADIYLKDDSHLPSETFKARGAAIALGRAVEFGVAEIVMPSAGNAGAAWSLYAARAGVSLTVVLAKSAPLFNQLEIEVAGAELELVDGTIADAGRRAREIARDRGAFLAATFSEPYRVEGKKTCWLEVFDALGSRDAMRLPDTIVLPVGGGVAAVAAAKAVGEVTALAWAGAGRPKIIGVQPARCAPLVRAFERGDSEARPWPEDPTTVAAGLRVPAPAEGTLVLDVVRRSGGAMIAVTDDEIVAAMRAVASREGVFPCPEGAAAFAATARLASKGALQGPVVVYNTGAGTKYVDELARFRLL